MDLKTNRLLSFSLFLALLISSGIASAQTNLITKFKLEVRADFDYFDNDSVNATSGTTISSNNPYGLHGMYFNLLLGGNLTDQFSYYFRQRIMAKPGTVSLFDNTDFLYLTYKPNKNWQLCAGKDALSVGGFEYDAPPIDVLFSTRYWDNFYCFQPAVSARYISNDGKHSLTAQVANSPYVHYDAALGLGLGNEWQSGLLAYGLLWNGDFGHFKTLYSANLFQRVDRKYIGYFALGNKVVYDNFDFYVDLINHSLTLDDWGKNFAVVSRLDFHISNVWNFFVKGAYEQNHSAEDLLNFSTTGNSLDCFVEAGHDYTLCGAGVEFRPAKCPAVRIHAFVANKTDAYDYAGSRMIISSLDANIGITWDMDMLKAFHK